MNPIKFSFIHFLKIMLFIFLLFALASKTRALVPFMLFYIFSSLTCPSVLKSCLRSYLVAPRHVLYVSAGYAELSEEWVGEGHEAGVGVVQDGRLEVVGHLRRVVQPRVVQHRLFVVRTRHLGNTNNMSQLDCLFVIFWYVLPVTSCSAA